jgi:D-sedoheptulose 7-phosphate isomerase
MSRAELVQLRLRESIEMCQSLLEDPTVVDTVEAVVQATVDAIRSGGKILLCGNGGSAADAQHLAAELIGRFCLDREPFPAVALADNVAALTAIANDYAYADVFARAVRGLGRAGDVVMGFSTSGQSANVVAALMAGREEAMVTVAFVGCPGSAAQQVADHALCVPGERTAGIQEGHMVLGHAIFELVEQELCGA